MDRRVPLRKRLRTIRPFVSDCIESMVEQQDPTKDSAEKPPPPPPPNLEGSEEVLSGTTDSSPRKPPPVGSPPVRFPRPPGKDQGESEPLQGDSPGVLGGNIGSSLVALKQSVKSLKEYVRNLERSSDLRHNEIQKKLDALIEKSTSGPPWVPQGYGYSGTGGYQWPFGQPGTLTNPGDPKDSTTEPEASSASRAPTPPKSNTSSASNARRSDTGGGRGPGRGGRTGGRGGRGTPGKKSSGKPASNTRDPSTELGKGSTKRSAFRKARKGIKDCWEADDDTYLGRLKTLARLQVKWECDTNHALGPLKDELEEVEHHYGIALEEIRNEAL